MNRVYLMLKAHDELYQTDKPLAQYRVYMHKNNVHYNKSTSTSH